MSNEELTQSRIPFIVSALRGKIAQIAMLGGSGYLVHEVFEIWHAYPSETFAIIRGWGPAFVAIFALIFIVGRQLDRQALIAQQNADAQSRSASALQQTAEAMVQLANRDDSEAQRNQLLIEHAAAETNKLVGRFDHVIGRLDRQDESLARIEKSAGSGKEGMPQ